MADTTRSDIPGSAAGASPSSAPADPPAPRLEDLPPAARRALAEAEERRRAAAEAEAKAAAGRPRELGGQPGPDPIRDGDWETGGIASDF